VVATYSAGEVEATEFLWPHTGGLAPRADTAVNQDRLRTALHCILHGEEIPAPIVPLGTGELVSDTVITGETDTGGVIEADEPDRGAGLDEISSTAEPSTPAGEPEVPDQAAQPVSLIAPDLQETESDGPDDSTPVAEVDPLDLWRALMRMNTVFTAEVLTRRNAAGPHFRVAVKSYAALDQGQVRQCLEDKFPGVDVVDPIQVTVTRHVGD
jgi:hypothetical protein